jgi:phage I-like protein
MKKLITYLAAGLLIAGAQSLMAQSATNSVNPPVTKTPGEHKGLAILKLVGLTPADVKGLTREEKQAKIKTAATNVEAELQAKKANGTLTAEGQIRLDRIEKYLAHAGHKKAGTPPDN